MPELPEVETIRRDLQRVVRGKAVAGVVVRKRKLIKSNPRTFGRKLRGGVVASIARRGKLLIFSWRGQDLFLLVHLKMTGQLIYRDGKQTVAGGHGYPAVEELPNKYSHIIISFSDGAKLFFNDMRQFGFMRLVDGEELQAVLAGYGVEPLTDDFTPARLWSALRGRQVTVKQVLLDQTVVAGLGNIYVDEACFYAGVRPTRRASRITKVEAERLHRAVRQVLKRAIIKRGTTFGDYRDGLGGVGNFVRLLKVYGRAGQRCRRCQEGVIKKVKLAGRGTSFCPRCQA